MKERQELFSIGEIARAVGVTRRMILNYEEHGLIRPDIKKGDAGNRYYTIDTFTKIRNIRILQDLGLSLDEIQGYYDDSIDLLSMIRRLEKLRDQLNLNIEKLYERTSAVPAQVRKLRLPDQLVYRKCYCSDSIAEKTVLLRNTALEAMRAYGTDTTRRMYFIEYPISAPLEAVFCVAVPPRKRGRACDAPAANGCPEHLSSWRLRGSARRGAAAVRIRCGASVFSTRYSASHLSGGSAPA